MATRPNKSATATTSRPRSGTRPAAVIPRANAQQIIWQGASLDGQHIFRLTRAGLVWQLQQATLGTAATLSFKPVTTAEMYLLAFAAMGTQYAVMFVPGTASLAANRSIPRTTANAIPATRSTNNAAPSGTVAKRRVRSRVSVNRSAVAAAT